MVFDYVGSCLLDGPKRWWPAWVHMCVYLLVVSLSAHDEDDDEIEFEVFPLGGGSDGTCIFCLLYLVLSAVDISQTYGIVRRERRRFDLIRIIEWIFVRTFGGRGGTLEFLSRKLFD